MKQPVPQELAREIKARAIDCSAKLDSSISAMAEEADPRQVSMYRRLIGEAMGELFINVLSPIYRQYPELEPEELQRARVSPPEQRLLSPRIKVALIKTLHDVEEKLCQLVASVKVIAGAEAASELEVALQSTRASIAHVNIFINRLPTAENAEASDVS
jgi:hypothetical protein